MCEESASFDLTSTDVSLCISDVDTILKAKMKEQEYSTEGGDHILLYSAIIAIFHLQKLKLVKIWRNFSI